MGFVTVGTTKDALGFLMFSYQSSSLLHNIWLLKIGSYWNNLEFAMLVFCLGSGECSC